MTPIRKLSCHLCIVLVALATLPVARSAAADRGGAADLVVTLDPGASIDDVASRNGVEKVEQIPGTTTFLVRARRGKEALEQLQTDAAVRKASPDGPVRRQQTVGFPLDTPELIDASSVPSPADEYEGQLGREPLESLGVDTANALTQGGSEVVVAVLDTGIDPNHPAVAGRLWTNPAETPNGIDDDADGYVDDVYGYDFVDDGPSPDESATSGSVAGHGTFIAGIVTLMAPSARVMPLRVLGPDGIGSAFDAARAINFATQHGARIISMSFGADAKRPPRVLRDAIESARALGVVLVAAVGNDAAKRIPYPASDWRNVIAVGAVDDSGHKAGFSNFAKHRVDIWAPGTELVSAFPGSYEGGGARYARWSGTSFAAAVISAECAILLSTQSIEGPDEVLGRIVSNAGDVPPDRDGQESPGKSADFFEAVGSVFRDAGDLDVWATADMYSSDEGQDDGGYVTLRTIGPADRLTAYGWGLDSFGAYDLYVTPLAAPGTFLKVTTDGPIAADQFGNAKVSAANSQSASGPPVPILPIPVDDIGGVYWARAGDGVPVCVANVDRRAAGVTVWAGVGLKPVDAPEPAEAPFGWTWFSYEPVSEADSRQSFEVTTCQLEPSTEYVIMVDGVETARTSSLDEGSLTVLFSNDPEDIAHGAIPLDPEAMPQLFPVTVVHALEVDKVEGDALVPILSGSFDGTAKRLAVRR